MPIPARCSFRVSARWVDCCWPDCSEPGRGNNGPNHEDCRVAAVEITDIIYRAGTSCLFYIHYEWPRSVEAEIGPALDLSILPLGMWERGNGLAAVSLSTHANNVHVFFLTRGPPPLPPTVDDPRSLSPGCGRHRQGACAFDWRLTAVPC